MAKKFKQKEIYVTLCVIHFVFCIQYFQELGEGSEFAGAMIRAISKFEMIFLALLYPLIILLINSILIKLYKKGNWHYGSLILISTLSVFLFNENCKSITHPSSLSESEIKIKEKERADNINLRVEQALKKTYVFTVKDSILMSDKKEIQKIVCNEWDNFYLPMMQKRPDCESYLLRLSNLLNINFDGIEKDSIIKHRKKTTQTDYILYGPGCHSFISVLTYEISKDPNIKFAPVLLLCHKIQKSIYAYSFTNQIQSDLFSSSTREAARNNALIYAFFQSSYNRNRDYHDYGFGNTLLYLKPEECLPSVRFWNAPGVLNLFKFHSDTNVIVEYPKVPGHKDFDKQRRQIIVYKN